MKKNGLILAALVMIFVCASCGSHYMVKDPATDKTYYTQKIESQKSGAVQFKDGKTGSEVTLQNSEISEISEDEYKAGVTPPEKKTE